MSPLTRRKYASTLHDQRVSTDDSWHRAVEFLFERLVERWDDLRRPDRGPEGAARALPHRHARGASLDPRRPARAPRRALPRRGGPMSTRPTPRRAPTSPTRLLLGSGPEPGPAARARARSRSRRSATWTRPSPTIMGETIDAAARGVRHREPRDAADLRHRQRRAWRRWSRTSSIPATASSAASTACSASGWPTSSRAPAPRSCTSRPSGAARSTSERLIAAAADGLDAMVVVHGETSTGVAQPLDGPRRRLPRARRAAAVDCVTSLGGHPLRDRRGRRRRRLLAARRSA